MASDLPAPVAEAGLLFQRASVVGDPEAMKRIIEWGHQQIDVAYPEDPLRAPLNVIRRLRAHYEWDKVVHTTGRELRGTIMSAIVRDLEFEIKRRQDDTLARDAEARRRDAVLFDAEVRTKEQEFIVNLHNQITQDQMRLQHQLNQEAAENESKRRMEERAHETQQQINQKITEIIVAAMGRNPTDEVIRAAQRVGHQVAEIRSSTELTDDDKHDQIMILLQAMPQIFAAERARHV